MRFIAILFSTTILGMFSNAQQTLSIRQDNRLAYNVTVNGQTFPMFAQIDSLSPAYCSLTWNFEDGRSGRFIMEKNSLDNAGYGYWKQPVVGEELVLPASRSVLMLSRTVYSSLIKNKNALFDDYAIAVKPAPADNVFKLQDKIVDALYLESESGTKIWVLNNPSTPLILKMEGNPFHVNLELIAID